MRFLLFILCLYPLLGVSYTAKTLKVKDYEEMRAILKGYITRSRAEAPQQMSSDGLEEAVSELKKGLKVLFMRPDADNMISSLLPLIQNEIINHRAFIPVFKEIVEKSISEFKSEKGSVSYQASLLYLIENTISYLQSINTKASTEILRNIKTANLKISKKLANYLILEMGRGKTANPSDLAKRVLSKRLKENKIAEEKKKAKERKEAERQKAKQAQKNANVKTRDPSSNKDTESSNQSTVEVEL